MAVDAAVQGVSEVLSEDRIADMPRMTESAESDLGVGIQVLEEGAAIDVDALGMRILGQADPPGPGPHAQALGVGDLEHLVVAVRVIGDPEAAFEHRPGNRIVFGQGGAGDVSADQGDLADPPAPLVQVAFLSRVVEGLADDVGAGGMAQQMNVGIALELRLPLVEPDDAIADQPNRRLGGIPAVFQVIEGLVVARLVEGNDNPTETGAMQIRLKLPVTLHDDVLIVVVAVNENHDVAGTSGVDLIVGHSVCPIANLIEPLVGGDFLTRFQPLLGIEVVGYPEVTGFSRLGDKIPVLDLAYA